MILIAQCFKKIVKWADEKDEEEGGAHHYRTITRERARESIIRLDQMIDKELEYLREKRLS